VSPVNLARGCSTAETNSRHSGSLPTFSIRHRCGERFRRFDRSVHTRGRNWSGWGPVFFLFLRGQHRPCAEAFSASRFRRRLGAVDKMAATISGNMLSTRNSAVNVTFGGKVGSPGNREATKRQRSLPSESCAFSQPCGPPGPAGVHCCS
jgi:hypothetical protein